MIKSMTYAQAQVVDELHFNKGLSGRRIARILGLPKSTVNDFLARRRSSMDQAPQGPKVLIFDIETAPSIAYHWRRFKENISQKQVIQEGFMLCWSAKWLGSEHIMSDSLHHHSDLIEPDNDKPVVRSLWRLLDQADVIVAHNGDNFDEPTLNARAMYHGLQPPHPSKQVDTLKIARNRFKFNSNSLDAIAQYLDIEEGKMSVDFGLWRRCMEGDLVAFDEMLEYNMRDVTVLEAVYLKMRAWDRRHPNLHMIAGESGMGCGVCGSKDVEPTDRFAHTNVSKFPTYRCNGCGAVLRTGQTALTKEDRQNLLRNIAR